MVLIEWLRRRLNLPDCRNCKVLEHQLEIANEEKRKLLNTIIEALKPKEITPIEIEEKEPAKPVSLKAISNWRVQAALLEAEDRKKFELLKRREEEQRSIEQLEKEVLGDDAIQTSNAVASSSNG